MRPHCADAECIRTQSRNAGKAIVLNLHDPEEHWGDQIDAVTRLNRTSRFTSMLKEYQVSAVFAGHIHERIGLNPTIAAFGDVPVFYYGSSINSRYLLVQ